MAHRYEHIENINRLRIAENTEARLRLQRFEKSDNWDNKFLEKLYSSFPENIESYTCGEK